MTSKCRSSSILLKNGNPAEKIKTRRAAAKQKNKMSASSLRFVITIDLQNLVEIAR
jgi:hypothetical protein